MLLAFTDLFHSIEIYLNVFATYWANVQGTFYTLPITTVGSIEGLGNTKTK